MRRVDQLIDHNILACSTFSFLSGINLAHEKLLSTQYYSIAGLLTILFLLFYQKKHITTKYLLLLLLIVAGALHQSYFNQTPKSPHHVYHYTNTENEIVIVGTIDEMIVYNGESSRFLLDGHFIRTESMERLTPVTGTVQLSYRGDLTDDYAPGTKVAVRTKLKRPTGYIGDGVFYYPKFLARKNIWAKGYIRSHLHIYPVTEQTNFFKRIRYLPEKLRNRIGHELDRLVPEASGLYRAILIGDKSLIDGATIESFKACGIMHILAISGLHMAVVTGLTYGMFLLLLRQSTYLMFYYDIRKLAVIMTLPLLFFYSLLTGSNAPVMRSFLMAALVMTALCVHRRKSPLALMSFAALILLIISPHQLFTVSFQLSFVAISSILFLFPTIQRLFSEENSLGKSLSKKIQAGVISSLLVSIVACVATLPLLLFYFNRFSLVSPLTNLFFEPVICLWSLPLGLTGIFFLNISPTIAEILFSLGSYGLILTERLCLQLSQLQFIEYRLSTPSLWSLYLYYFLLILVFFCKSGKYRVFALLSFCLSLVILLFSFPQFSDKRIESRLTIIDVGQGSATLIEFDNNQTVLVDCGNMTFSDTSIGEQVVAPMLWKKGIHNIDTIFITHGDTDHYSGVPFIVKHFGVENIVVADRYAYSQNFSSMLREIEFLGATVKRAFTGERFSFGSASVDCLYNFAEKGDLVSRDEKNRGLVLKANIYDNTILLPGDIDDTAEQRLLELNIESTLLLASHHGSRTSNTGKFLDSVRPEYLLVSSGVVRKKQFPHKEVIKRAEERNIPILATNQNGSLEITVTKKGYAIAGLKNRKTNPLLKKEKIVLATGPYSTVESSR